MPMVDSPLRAVKWVNLSAQFAEAKGDMAALSLRPL
jgi:hypothetical protein